LYLPDVDDADDDDTGVVVDVDESY